MKDLVFVCLYGSYGAGCVVCSAQLKARILWAFGTALFLSGDGLSFVSLMSLYELHFFDRNGTADEEPSNTKNTYAFSGIVIVK